MFYGTNPHMDEEEDYHNTSRWKDLRYWVLREHEGRCCLCGRRATEGRPLEVDHIKPKSKYPQLQWDWDNMQVLCKDCNQGKSNKYEDDWRLQPVPPPRHKPEYKVDRFFSEAEVIQPRPKHSKKRSFWEVLYFLIDYTLALGGCWLLWQTFNPF